MTRRVAPIKISDSEWEVMRVIWTMGQADAQQIVAVLSTSMDWKAPTVKTLLGRLVKKGALTTEMTGKKFIYFPIVTEEDTIRSATENLLSRICAKKLGQTLADLIRETDLTAADIQLLTATIQTKEATEVQCNCIPGQCECQEHEKKADDSQ